MFGLTTLGTVHTAIGLIALISGAIALIKYHEISPHNRAGQIYLWTTLLTALTSLGIFQHGGFGPPHILALLTLVALAVGMVSAYTSLYGRWSRYTQALAFTTTILFHFIPGVTESSSRFPIGAPLFPTGKEPLLQQIYVGLLVLLVIGLFFQLRWIHRESTNIATARPI